MAPRRDRFLTQAGPRSKSGARPPTETRRSRFRANLRLLTLSAALLSLGSALDALAPPNGEVRTILFVDAEAGGDNQPGTEQLPLATLQECLDRWQEAAGPFECRGRGVFHEQLTVHTGGPSGDRRNRLTAWDTDHDGRLDDESFVLDGENTRSVALTLGIPKPDNVEVSYLHFRNYDSATGCGGNVQFVAFPWGSGGDDWWLHHNRFETLAPGCDWTTSGSAHIAIMPSGANRLLVEDNEFRDIGGFVMRYFGGHDITFRRNLVEVVSTGLKAWGASVDRLTVADNVFLCDGSGRQPNEDGCTSQAAVSFSNDVQHGVIEDNVFENCVTAITLGTDSRFGERKNAHHRVEGNVIRSSSVVCNRYASMVAIKDCSPRSQENGAALAVEDVVLRNNAIQFSGGETDGSAIFVSSGHPDAFTNRFVIDHNTITGFRFGLRVDQCAEDFPFELNEVRVANNIFSDLRDGYYSMSWSGWQGPLPAEFSSDRNVFSGGPGFHWPELTPVDTWQSEQGQDRSSRECTPVWRGPGDFHLAGDDTCARDQALENATVLRDIDGEVRPYGPAPDIGADEACPRVRCDCLFCDDFEAGDFAAWSRTGQ